MRYLESEPPGALREAGLRWVVSFLLRSACNALLVMSCASRRWEGPAVVLNKRALVCPYIYKIRLIQFCFQHSLLTLTSTEIILSPLPSLNDLFPLLYLENCLFFFWFVVFLFFVLHSTKVDHSSFHSFFLIFLYFGHFYHDRFHQFWLCISSEIRLDI